MGKNGLASHVERGGRKGFLGVTRARQQAAFLGKREGFCGEGGNKTVDEHFPRGRYIGA